MRNSTLFWRLASRLAQTAAERAERRAETKSVRITADMWEQNLAVQRRFADHIDRQEHERREQEDERLLRNAPWYVRHDEDVFKVFRAALKNPETRDTTIKLLTPPAPDEDRDTSQDYPREWLMSPRDKEDAAIQAALENGDRPVRRTRIYAED